MGCVALKCVIDAAAPTLMQSVMVALIHVAPPQAMQRWPRQAKTILTRPIHFNRCPCFDSIKETLQLHKFRCIETKGERLKMSNFTRLVAVFFLGVCWHGRPFALVPWRSWGCSDMQPIRTHVLKVAVSMDANSRATCPHTTRPDKHGSSGVVPLGDPSPEDPESRREIGCGLDGAPCEFSGIGQGPIF